MRRAVTARQPRGSGSGPSLGAPSVAWAVHLAEASDAERVQQHQAAVLITISRWLAGKRNHTEQVDRAPGEQTARTERDPVGERPTRAA